MLILLVFFRLGFLQNPHYIQGILDTLKPLKVLEPHPDPKGSRDAESKEDHQPDCGEHGQS